MNGTHPMMPVTNHDEHAEQMFVRDFKMYLAEQLGPLQRELAARIEEHPDALPRGGADTGPSDAGPVTVTGSGLHARLLEHDAYRWWLSVRRSAQELLWDSVARCVDRQSASLDAKARIHRPQGSLTLDETFEPPGYAQALDIHLMPGGYTADDGPAGVRQGAIMDRGGAVFLLGRNGGLMNDGRGHTLVSHLFEKYPQLAPARTLDLGCGVGASSVAVASYFDAAEHHAIDLGTSMLRYAHARAEHLGTPIHFSQQNAAATCFADESFDLVYSCVLLHETSAAVLRKILREAYRVLRTGGVMIHLEVPLRDGDDGAWGLLQAEFEARYNNEPFWRGATGADYRSLLEEIGLTDVSWGFQTAVSRASRADRGFTTQSQGVFRCWAVASARK